MVSFTSIVAKTQRVKGMHIENTEYITEEVHTNGEVFERGTIIAHVRPFKRLAHQCPCCRETRPIYDHKAKDEVYWRGADWNGARILLAYKPARVSCPKCGVRTEWIPWQDGDSHYLACFNNEVAYVATVAPKTVVAEYFGINWRTVGNCIAAVHGRLEPDVTVRLRGVKRICVDETSYKKGHKYITVVYDMDRNRVIWIHEGRSEEVFSLFCEELTEEERNAMEIVAGDGAQWIDACKNKYFPNATRCVDFFHVVGWINDALDRVRIDATRAAEEELENQTQEYQQELKKVREEWKEKQQSYRNALKLLEKYSKKRGRPSKEVLDARALVAEFEAAFGEDASPDNIDMTPEQKAHLQKLKARVSRMSRSKYALGKNPENLTQYQADKLKLIEASNDEVYKAYRMKEQLRVILHMKDWEGAADDLDQWLSTAWESGIKPFVELADKIKRHHTNIIDAIRCQVNSSKSESTNTTIKAIIAIARGFRNLDNLFAMIYLRCSDLVIPLDNRYRPSNEKVREMRERANQRRKQREEANRKAIA